MRPATAVNLGASPRQNRSGFPVLPMGVAISFESAIL
jgi:hypothetical protein